MEQLSGLDSSFLYLETGYAFPFQYGPDSYRLHLQSVSETACQVVIVSSPIISLDIDRQADLDEFIARCMVDPAYRETESWRFLSTTAYVGRSGNRQQVQG